jgi:small-conductance mechanosensitive channel
MDFLDTTYYHNTIQTYIIAAAIAFAVFLLATGVRAFVLGRLKKLVRETSTRIDDLAVHLVKQTRHWVILLLSLYAGTLALVIEPDHADVIRIVAVACFAFQVGRWASSAITFLLKDVRERKEAEGDTGSLGAIMLVAVVARMLVWILVGLLILGNLGVDVTALVAGLGIGGLAVALAVKNILSDLFSSVSIMLDKPFEVGDFIIVGDQMGSVENIGIRSTRLRAPSGEQLVFGNEDLIGSRIRNMKRMADRRAVMGIRIGYDTPPDKLKQAPDILRGIIEAKDSVRFDRCHLKALGESAIDLEAVFYMTNPDYALYMNTQQAINLEVVQAFAEEGIRIAYPTQTVQLQDERKAA